MVRIGVVGYGYWGPNLARNFAETPGATLAMVSDARPERLAVAGVRHPGVRLETDYRKLADDPEVDAVAIATPAASHYEIGMAALRAGKHVLIEKPLASSSEEAEQLIEAAASRGLTLMVDHTFVYTGAVRTIQKIIAGNGLGELYYYDAVRINLGLIQPDVNVIWDLAVHDLSIMDHILPMKPCAVAASGVGHFSGNREDIAYLTLHFESRFIAHVHVNWLAPVKVRQILIGGSQKMIRYDDVEPSEKVKVYDKGVRMSPVRADSDAAYKTLVSYRTGDIWLPHLDSTEALRVEAAEFVACINTGARPTTDGVAGLRVVNLLECASESLRNRGQIVELGERVATV
ncbi:MAG: Gfo/Idh/MocA family oxidoreductase [Bryobacterales bacterium]|nr:Gfo/Idh/MocA family oxidoreductase [Bryobacterales bacterium]